jgi:hypothetical protein
MELARQNVVSDECWSLFCGATARHGQCNHLAEEEPVDEGSSSAI